MAIEKVVNIRINDNSSTSVKNVNALATSLNKVEGASSGVSTGMKESSLSILENGGAMGLLNDATGGVAMTIKDAVESLNLFSKSSKIATFFTGMYTTVVGASTGAMKIFRLALVGTGIGAIVVGLGLLIANFDKVKKAVFNLIPGLADIADFFGGIIENITDFVGATSEAERAMARLTEQADKSLAANKKFLQEEGDQVNKYTKAKIDAKNAYSEAIKEDGANQVKLAARLKRELLAIDKQHEADLKKVRDDAKTKADDEAKKNADKVKDDKKTANEAEIKAAEKAAEKKIDGIKSDAQKAYDVNEQAKQDMADVTAFRNTENEKREENDTRASANSYARMVADADEKKAFEDEQREYKKKVEQQLHDSLFSMADSTASLIENMEQLGMKKSKAATTLRKGMALAQIAIDTGKAISSAIPMAIDAGKGAASIGGPFAGVLGAIATASSYAGSLAMITSNVVRAKSLLSGGGAGGSGGSAGGGAAPSAPPQFNIVGQNSNNQLAQSIGKSQNRPVEAFVVSGNMTTAQSLDRNRIATATFNN